MVPTPARLLLLSLAVPACGRTEPDAGSAGAGAASGAGSMGADAVTIENRAHHIWFEHDDIADGSNGASDTATGDRGHLRVTFDHDRCSNIHLFDNLSTAAGNSYCASILDENAVGPQQA